jgi:hypothetical protein
MAAQLDAGASMARAQRGRAVLVGWRSPSSFGLGWTDWLECVPGRRRLAETAPLGNSCAKTEHILLAASSPKLHSAAATLLADCGASPDRVRDQLTRMLLQEAPELADRLRNRSLLSRVRMRNL